MRKLDEFAVFLFLVVVKDIYFLLNRQENTEHELVSAGLTDLNGLCFASGQRLINLRR